MRSVTVIVADRHEFPGALGFQSSIAAPGSVEVLGTDQFLVAQTGSKVFTWGTFAMPAGDLLVGSPGTWVLTWHAVCIHPVREA